MSYNEDILFYAFRYALGRMTYAVHDVASEIIRNEASISPRTRALMIQEIGEAIEKGNAGMDMDVREWQRVADTLKQA